MTTKNPDKLRFTKANIIEELRARAETVRQREGFTTMTGWSQVEKSSRARNRAYGEWDILKNLVSWIEDGTFGVHGK